MFLYNQKTEYTFFMEKEEYYMLGHHAGITKEELEIGLYVIKKNK